MNAIFKPLTLTEMICFTAIYFLFLAITLFFIPNPLYALLFTMIPYCIVGALYVLIREMR